MNHGFGDSMDGEHGVDAWCEKKEGYKRGKMVKMASVPRPRGAVNALHRVRRRDPRSGGAVIMNMYSDAPMA